jgi:protoporphyrinogen oxidase
LPPHSKARYRSHFPRTHEQLTNVENKPPQILKRSAVAVASVSLAQSRAFATVGVAPKKILIIGPGMAGLCAGYELTQLGHDVTILEARMRPGGRVQTLREPFSDGQYAEAGAARIPNNHDLTLKYVKLFGVALEPMYPSQLSALRWGGKSAQPMPIDGFTKALGEFFGSELGGNPARWSKIKGGSDLLPQAFAKRLADKIQYGAPVVRLEQDANAARAVSLAERCGPNHDRGSNSVRAAVFVAAKYRAAKNLFRTQDQSY